MFRFNLLCTEPIKCFLFNLKKSINCRTDEWWWEKPCIVFSLVQQWHIKHNYHLMYLFFIFIGCKSSTWPGDNCLQIMVCSCVVPSKWVLLQIICCPCRMISYLQISEKLFRFKMTDSSLCTFCLQKQVGKIDTENIRIVILKWVD